MMLRFLSVLVLLGAMPVTQAETITLANGVAVLRLEGDQLKANRSLQYSGILSLIITVEGGPGLDVVCSDIEADAREWIVLRQTRGQLLPPNEGQRRWQKEIDLEPVAPVKLKLPAITLRYRDAPTQSWITPRWSEVTIDVQGPQGEDVRGQLSIEPLPAADTAARFPFRPLLIGALIGSLLAFALWWARRPRPGPVVTPEVRAVQDLLKLRFRPAAPGAVHEGASQIVRRFVEARFAVQAPRQTTEEMLQGARASESYPQAALGPLEALLADCDRIKFTGTPPIEEECAAVVTQACQFIRDACAVESG